MILMPCAPRRIAFCIARFIARRNMMRFSSCWVIDVGDQLRIDFGLAHFLDVDGHRHAQAARQFGLQVLDVLALLADHHARTCREDGDAGVLGGALDQDARDGGVLQLAPSGTRAPSGLRPAWRRSCLFDRVPARRPVARDRQAEAGRMDFLSHGLPCASVADGHVDVAGGLADAVAAALGACGEALQRGALLDVDRLDLQLVDVGAVVVLGVRDRRLERLLDDAGGLLLA